MSIYHALRPGFASAGFANHIGGIFLSAMHRASDWKDARETERQLSKLTDRELLDIGLTRADVTRAARR